MIPNPCPMRWEEMDGDAKRRFCDDCGRYVYAVAAYSDRVCAYSEGEGAEAPRSRRAVVAGALLTTIAPLLAQEGQFVIAVKEPLGAGVEGALVTVGDRKVKTDHSGIASFIGLPVGRQEVRVEMAGFRVWMGAYTISNGEPRKVEAVLEVGRLVIVKKTRATRSSGAPGRVSLSVRDGSGAVVAGADVVVMSESGAARHARTDDDGNAVISDAESGEVKVNVEREGFATWRETRELNRGGEVRLEVKMVLRGQDVKVDVKESAGRRFWNWLSSCTRR